MSKIDNLPILGNVSLPVHIMHYSKKENSKKFFQSGFAFFAVADDQADVKGANSEEFGSLGSCMGGHYQVHSRRKKDNIDIIINVEDIWTEVHKLFDSADVKIKLESIEDIYKKYWDEKTKNDKLEKEIKQMQIDAETEKIMELAEKKNAASEKAEKKRKAEEVKAETEAKKLAAEGKQFGDTVIIDNNDWSLNDEIPSQDWMLEKAGMKITPDFGIGVKTFYNGESYTFKRNPRKKPVVTLEISTWKGMGADAIHYYGSLKIYLPEMENDNKPGYTHSTGGLGAIPMYSNSEIQLTQVLEQWEIEKYPNSYKYLKAGQRNRGFYAIAGVERRAKEVFNKIFGEGWTLKIEKRF